MKSPYIEIIFQAELGARLLETQSPAFNATIELYCIYKNELFARRCNKTRGVSRTLFNCRNEQNRVANSL